MVKQDLYVGEFYKKGINGKRILVVGHQLVSEEENPMANEPNWADNYEPRKDNIELIEQMIHGGYKREKDKRDGNRAFKIFVRLLSRNHQLTLLSNESKNLWKSLAFCNYIQVPTYNFNGKTVTGKDRYEYYEDCLPIFKEYLDEIEPDIVIVWGSVTFPYISRLGNRVTDYHFVIYLPSGKNIDVVKICHPSILSAGYTNTEKILSEVGL